MSKIPHELYFESKYFSLDDLATKILQNKKKLEKAGYRCSWQTENIEDKQINFITVGDYSENKYDFEITKEIKEKQKIKDKKSDEEKTVEKVIHKTRITTTYFTDKKEAFCYTTIKTKGIIDNLNESKKAIEDFNRITGIELILQREYNMNS